LKRLLIGLAALALAGCSTALKPVRRYNPEWCELSVFEDEVGTVFIYTAPQGTSMQIVPKK